MTFPALSPQPNQGDISRAVNHLLGRVASGYPFPMLAAAPTNVSEGYTYYDTALSKVRTWNGSAFQNHW